MPPKQKKKSPVKPNPDHMSTHPKNAVTHPGQVVQTQCSTKCPESIIQAEKAEKTAKHAKKEQQSIKRNETAEDIVEYEHNMVINDDIESIRFPCHRDKVGTFYCLWTSYYY